MTRQQILEVVDEFGGKPFFDCVAQPIMSIKWDRAEEHYLNPEAARWRPEIGWTLP